jgi:CheY-like chemotaxis protein
MAVVLVVEDDFDSRLAIAYTLKDAGYEVVTACDGVEALDALYQYPKPDVILLDLTMPDLDGWSFVKIKNGSQEIVDIPVIVLTAVPIHEARSRGLEGTQLVIPKPFNVDDLLRAISVVTKK